MTTSTDHAGQSHDAGNPRVSCGHVLQRVCGRWGDLPLVPVFLALIIVLPLAGAALSGKPLSQYAEFPPTTQYVSHNPFSWPVFAGLAILTVALVIPFVIRFSLRPPPGICRPALGTPHSSFRAPFPWWGGVGLLLGLVAWAFAWGGPPCFVFLRRHMFTPLWIAYILVINAMTIRRSGRCLMTERPREFALLFPLSAAFWWLFEYLNRFVQNWHYVGIADMSPTEYFLFATIPFSTVLPAVLGTAEWLGTIGVGRWGSLQGFTPAIIRTGVLSWMALALSCAGLAGVGVWPNALFPLLWVAPLCILVSLQALAGRSTLLNEVSRGDWRRVVRLALAALICGFFWEMWNSHSLAKWIYSVPYVNRFHIFEMPLLGYAGYLPFGLECAVVADWVLAHETMAP